MEIYTLGDYRHVLVVIDPNVADTGYRARLVEALDAMPYSPVRRGTHDFWVTFPPKGGGEHSGEDMSVRPRPQRGILRIPLPPDDRPVTYEDWLRTLLEEHGHHWLAPRDLQVDGNRVVPEAEVVAMLASPDATLRGLTILGRANAHWSSHLRGGGSPMDGVAYDSAPAAAGLDVWVAGPPDRYPVTGDPGPLATLHLTARYDALDRWCMGRSLPGDADQPLRWMHPAYFSPFRAQAGVFVVFDGGAFEYFGFTQDHRTVQRTDASVEEGEPGVPVPGYDALDTNTGVALRVRRVGESCVFEAGAVRVADWDREGLRLPDATWTTIDTRAHREPPVAIGLIVRRFTRSPFIECGFRDLRVDGNVVMLDQVPHRTSPRRSPVAPWWASLDLTEPALDLPKAGPLIAVRDGWLQMALPYASVDAQGAYSSYDGSGGRPIFGHEGSDVNDEAPKVAMAAPSGDFRFGTLARISRAVPNPRAYGEMLGLTVWGNARRLRVGDTTLPAGLVAKQAPPLDGRYRCAFIIVAASPDAVTDDVVRRVDNLRRYWGPTGRAQPSPLEFDTVLEPIAFRVLDDRSHRGPAVASAVRTPTGSKLVLAWCGTDEHHRLNVMVRPDGEAPTRVTLADRSDRGVALVAIDDQRLVLAWVGMDEDRHLNVVRSEDGGVSWSGKTTLRHRTQHAPALARFGNRLVLAFTGTDGALNVLSSTLERAPWTTAPGPSGESSGAGPALAVFRNQLYVAWTGTDARGRLNLARSGNLRTWGATQTLDERSDTGPALAGTANALWLAWSGTDANHHINLVRTDDGEHFAQKRTLRRQRTLLAPALGGRPDGNLDLAWTGLDEGNHLNVEKVFV